MPCPRRATRTSGPYFDNHGYGLGLPPGSPHRKAINQAILEYTGTDAWRELLVSVLGAG